MHVLVDLVVFILGQVGPSPDELLEKCLARKGAHSRGICFGTLGAETAIALDSLQGLVGPKPVAAQALAPGPLNPPMQGIQVDGQEKGGFLGVGSPHALIKLHFPDMRLASKIS